MYAMITTLGFNEFKGRNKFSLLSCTLAIRLLVVKQYCLLRIINSIKKKVQCEFLIKLNCEYQLR